MSADLGLERKAVKALMTAVASTESSEILFANQICNYSDVTQDRLFEYIEWLIMNWRDNMYHNKNFPKLYIGHPLKKAALIIELAEIIESRYGSN